MTNQKSDNLTKTVFPERIAKANKQAIESFEFYKKTIDILEKANLASGKTTAFKSSTGSALHTPINCHGNYSTKNI